MRWSASKQPPELPNDVGDIVPAVTVPVSEQGISGVSVASVAAGKSGRCAQKEKSRQSHRVREVDPANLVEVAGNLAGDCRSVTDVDGRGEYRGTG